MKIRSLHFDLPDFLIAQRKNINPGKARLLVMSRKNGRIRHGLFGGLASLLREGDLIVLNDSAVLPSRSWGLLETGGQIEVSLVAKVKKGLWEALLRPDIDLSKDTRILFCKGKLSARILKRTSYGGWILKLDRANEEAEDILRSAAEVNTPFYIRKTIKLADYQNAYARCPGSIQCPTSGLHFDSRTLNKIKSCGVDIGFIRLHVSGSVLPVNVADYNNLSLPKEYLEVNAETKRKIEIAKIRGGRVIAVGTTVARALETAADDRGRVRRLKGWTGLTIAPGYGFKVIDGLLTNFHLPSSSHLFLTSAFGGVSNVLNAYKEALRNRYRFLDFGDAMLII